MKLRIAILGSIFVLSASCCRRVPPPCWSSGGAFALTEASAAWAKLADQETYRRQSPPAAGELPSLCQADFDDLVKGVHCGELIPAYCRQSCPSDPGAGECVEGKGRVDVSERCWRGAFPGFQKATPSCGAFTLGPGGKLDQAP